MIKLSLPWPPGVNNLYRNAGNRRVITPRYKAWREEAWITARTQRPGKLTGAFKAHILLERPDRRKTDLDGRAKAILDLLVAMGVTPDDHLLQSLTLDWSPLAPMKPGFAHVTLTEA